MKAGCNHVQLALLHNLIKRFHSANYLFVAIICFAELVSALVHLQRVRDVSQFPFVVFVLVDYFCLW